MVPMRHAGHDEAIHIGENLRHVLALGRRRIRQRVSQEPWLDRRSHAGIVDILQEVGDPVDHLVTVLTKVFSRHVAGWRCRSFWLDVRHDSSDDSVEKAAGRLPIPLPYKNEPRVTKCNAGLDISEWGDCYRLRRRPPRCRNSMSPSKASICSSALPLPRLNSIRRPDGQLCTVIGKSVKISPS